MKNIYFLFVFFLLFSCSSNDGNNQYKLLRSTVDVFDDGSSVTTSFTYNGNKIDRIDQADKRTVFNYTGNLITQSIIFDKTTQTADTLKYIYKDDQLIQINSSENYVINYNYNGDGSISYEKTQKDSGNNVLNVIHGVLNFQNNNLMQEERTYYDLNKNAQITETTGNIEYDAKINPMQNVLGFDKLLDYLMQVSRNNSKSFFAIYRVEYTGSGVTSSLTPYNSTYTYDSNGYPVMVESQRPFQGNNTSHVKTYYKYE